MDPLILTFNPTNLHSNGIYQSMPDVFDEKLIFILGLLKMTLLEQVWTGFLSLQNMVAIFSEDNVSILFYAIPY